MDSDGAGPSTSVVLPHQKPKKSSDRSTKRPKAAGASSKDRKEDLDALEASALSYVPPESLSDFSELPISEKTKKGLKKAFFTAPTSIQTLSVPLALKGQDVLGAARTGSGKTLAFLIPLLESLYRKKWGPQDGLGALVISPTRELAIQIFEVLRKIGPYHSFSAGLVIGGKNLKDESDRLTRMNILIATPGRLLQHMDQTVGFECDNLQMLVLDEADRILDMGFSRSLNAILAHLPKSRQTLLFSATQTQSVKDLARLSLKTPVSVGAEEKEKEVEGYSATPINLEQHYSVIELDKKLDVLFSFVRTHLKSKILVFLSSCKQVRFVYETFCKLHPGVPLLELHGKQKQTKRLDIFHRFTTSSTCCLFATDVAARGLDFPSVDWVIQVDCPEDSDTYIHRVGRTARYEAKGQALLLLCPSEEEAMVKSLEERNVKVGKIKIKESKTQSIKNQLQSFAFQDPELKYLGQRAFISYLKSVYVQKNKAIFQVGSLPVEQFAESLGLPGAPQIKFISQEQAKKKKNRVKVVEMKEGAEVESADEQETVLTTPSSSAPAVRTKYDRMFEKKNQNILSEHYTSLIDHSSSNDPSALDSTSNDVDDFITLKRANHDIDASSANVPLSSDLSKRKLKAGESRKAALKLKGAPTKLVFDEEGAAHEIYELVGEEEEKGKKKGDEKERFVELEKGKMEEIDVEDRAVAREKRREKRRKEKEREKAAEEMPSGGPGPISMGDDSDSSSGGFDDDDDDEGGEGFPDIDIAGLLSSEDEDEDEEAMPPPAVTPFSKKRKSNDDEAAAKKSKRSKGKPSLEDEEALALRLLEG